MKIIKQTLPTLFLTASACMSGCAPVAPWERGNLAKPHMALEPYSLQSAFRTHTYGSREAASSSGSAEGGGCGCY